MGGHSVKRGHPNHTGIVFLLKRVTCSLRQIAEYMEELPKQEVTKSIVNAMLTQRETEDNEYFLKVMEAVYSGLPEDHYNDLQKYAINYYPSFVEFFTRDEDPIPF